MEYIDTRNARKSDNKDSFISSSSPKLNNVVKRSLVVMLMAICLVFAGSQSIQSTKASAGCEMVCSDPFIDPNSGQCVRECCPEDDKCMVKCELIPCKQ